MKNNNKK